VTQTTFNLIDDAWLPVRYLDGHEDELGLRAILRDAPEIRDLAIAFPLEYVATLRMVVTVLQSACDGPTSTADKIRWLDGHGALMPAIETYLAAWSERFELFHPERPFMQAVIGPDVQTGTIAALRPDWASGNNATLFDHHVDARLAVLSPGAAARALLTTLLFQPSGGNSRPFYRSNSPATTALQVLVDGRSLWETLVANAPNLGEPAARPAWERHTHDAERADAAGTTPDGWLDRATWRSRAIQLLPDDGARVSGARIHQHLKISDAPPFDPYAPVRRAKNKPPRVMRASLTKVLWRDAEALIEGLLPAGDHPTVLAQALYAFDRYDEAWLPGVRIIGQIVGPEPGKVADVREGRMPMSRALLEDDLLRDAVGSLIAAAENGAKGLRGAINEAATEMGAADGWGRASRWETGFWAALAGTFQERLATLALLEDPERVRDDVVAPWRDDVVAAARHAYDLFARDGAAGRAPRAIGRAQAGLDRRLKALYPREERR
jgi:CRISPR system Cascade subunit CasA